jgi:hypothetical protein
LSSTTSTTGTSLQFQYQDPNGVLHALPHPLQTYQIPFTRSFSSKGIFGAVDFSGIMPDMYNDGAGVAFRDTDIMFNGKHTLRLCPVQTTTTNVNPGRSANTQGIVCKFRRNNLVGTTGVPSNVFGWEQWMRWTSNGNFTSNIITSSSIYNRDGTNLWTGRLWIDLRVTPIVLYVLQSGGTWAQIGTYNMADGGTYQPENGLFDRAGQWSYVKLVIDEYNKTYRSVQFNEAFFDLTNSAVLSNNTIDSLADTGTRVLHFSTEYAQRNNPATEQFMNIAQPVATFE